jgi:sodium-coupled neutral amino acid transporter 2
MYAVHTIENELEDYSPWMQGVVWISLALCTTVYVMTGFSLVTQLFPTCSPTLTLTSVSCFPYSSLFNDVVRISYIGHIILVFPFTCFPLRLYFNGLVFSSARPFTLDSLRFAIVSIGFVVVVILSAIFITTVWVAFEFSGATVGLLLTFIFPVSITLKFIFSL